MPKQTSILLTPSATSVFRIRVSGKDYTTMLQHMVEFEVVRVGKSHDCMTFSPFQIRRFAHELLEMFPDLSESAEKKTEEEA